LSLLFLCWQSQGQSRLIDVSGKVVDADSLSPVSSVFIYVPDTEKGAITNENGFFSITIQPTDTLIFSAVNYLPKVYVLPDSLRSGRPFIEIALTLRTIELDEVVVQGHLNPAAVRRYLDNVNKKRRQENPPNIYRDKPQSEPKTRPAGREHTVSLGTSTKPEGGAALEGALTGLANLFNKRAQQQKRIAALLEARKNLEAQRAYREFINSKFNEDVVSEATGLEGQELNEFLDYCNLSDEFIYYASEYELLEAIFSRYYRFMNFDKF
jgi:hypothetical protein